MSTIEMTPLTNGEKSRTYVWPSGSRDKIDNVTHICVRPSGSHRLQTSDGLKHIVPAGWIRVEVEAVEWSV